MALTKYPYSKNANISVLEDEILADPGITTALDHIDLIDDGDPDTVDIWFVDPISGAEETALDAVVAAHTNPANPSTDLMHSYTGAPDDLLGQDGDVAFDPAAQVYYEKSGGSWGASKTILAEIDDQDVSATAESQTTSATWVDMASMTLTTSNTKSLKYRVHFNCRLSHSGNNKLIDVRLVIDGTPVAASVRSVKATGAAADMNLATLAQQELVNAKEIKVQWQTDAATASVWERSLLMRGLG